MYADDQMAKHLAAPDPHSQYAQKESPTFTGTPKAPTPAAGNNTTQVATTAFVQAALTAIINDAPATLDTLKEIAVAINNDPKFSTTINNALALKAPLSSPALTGTPTAPTAAQSVNNTQIATTAFVKSAIAGMVGSAPAALDTLNELAAALGNDPNFATTMLNALAGKQPLDNTLTNLSGKDVAGLLAYLGLGETINKASGAMQKSANGSDISDISAFRNALRLGAAATRDVGGDNASKLLDLDSFRSMMSGNGYIYIPCIATTGNPVKLMLQWGTVATQKGADAGYALPFAFPYAGLFATGNRGTSGYNAAMNVRIASRTHISIQNWSPSGEGTEDCCFIALGY